MQTYHWNLYTGNVIVLGMATRSPQQFAAPRAITLPASPIRALLDVHRNDNTIDLGGGHPEPGLFPRDALSEVAARLLSDKRALALQYAPTEGIYELRVWLTERLNQRGHAVQPDQILLTQGSQHALSSVAQVLGAPGQLALLEQPVYPGALQALALAECELGALPVTTQGWDATVLEDNNPHLVYVIPHFQNPTGRRATSTEKQALAALADQRGIFIIEDDAYGELSFDGSNNRPLSADCPEQGILIGSFSKTLCPGLRLGYIAAPRPLIGLLVKTLQATTLQPGTLAQHLAWELLSTFDYETHLTTLQRLYQSRARALSMRCHEVGLPQVAPQGGFFLWVETPGEASQLAKQAAARGLLTVPESAFRAPGLFGPDRHLRLAFSRYEDDAATARRLKQALLT